MIEEQGPGTVFQVYGINHNPHRFRKRGRRRRIQQDRRRRIDGRRETFRRVKNMGIRAVVEGLIVLLHNM